jgi:hypothetical protein
LEAAQHERGLRQVQASLQRQQDSQRDAQLVGRAGLVASGQSHLNPRRIKSEEAKGM